MAERRYGTCYFRNAAAVHRYFRKQGLDGDAVKAKIASNDVKLGKPPTKEDELLALDEDERYIIVTPATSGLDGWDDGNVYYNGPDVPDTEWLPHSQQVCVNDYPDLWAAVLKLCDDYFKNRKEAKDGNG